MANRTFSCGSRQVWCVASSGLSGGACRCGDSTRSGQGLSSPRCVKAVKALKVRPGRARKPRLARATARGWVETTTGRCSSDGAGEVCICTRCPTGGAIADWDRPVPSVFGRPGEQRTKTLRDVARNPAFADACVRHFEWPARGTVWPSPIPGSEDGREARVGVDKLERFRVYHVNEDHLPIANEDWLLVDAFASACAGRRMKLEGNPSLMVRYMVRLLALLEAVTLPIVEAGSTAAGCCDSVHLGRASRVLARPGADR